MSVAKINLDAFKIKSMDYRLVDDKADDAKSVDSEEASVSDINLQVNRGEAAHHEDNEFGKLLLSITITENNALYDREINLEVEGFFKYDKKLNIENEEEFKEYQDLLQINGTAILFPYIRSYISSVTSFDNVTKHLLLPTINVYELYSKK